MHKSNKNSNKFTQLYKDFCTRGNVFPKKSLLYGLDDGIIDVCDVHKWTEQDFGPLLRIIQCNPPIRFLAVRSGYISRCEEKIFAKKEIEPPVQSQNILQNLCEHISDLIRRTSSLTILELECLKLSKEMLQPLSQSLRNNNTLQHVSFRHSPIGDNGVLALLLGFRCSSTIASIDFTDCNIGEKGALHIACLIQSHSMLRHNTEWQASLREEKVNAEHSSGLKRITLNHNCAIGDEGVKYLIDALQDDLWFRALDLQNCGVTSGGVKICLDVLDKNHSLHVLDLRNNVEVDSEMLNLVKTKLDKNADGHIPMFKWLRLCKDEDETETNDHGLTFRQGMIGENNVKKNAKFVPWRVDERLNKVRGSRTNRPIGVTSLSIDYEMTEEEKRKHAAKTSCLNCYILQEDLVTTKAKLFQELDENSKLKAQLDEEICKREKTEAKLKKQSERRKNVDDDTFVHIQKTFEKFQGFLKLLNDSGLNEALNLDVSSMNIFQDFNQINDSKPEKIVSKIENSRKQEKLSTKKLNSAHHSSSVSNIGEAHECKEIITIHRSESDANPNQISAVNSETAENTSSKTLISENSFISGSGNSSSHQNSTGNSESATNATSKASDSGNDPSPTSSVSSLKSVSGPNSSRSSSETQNVDYSSFDDESSKSSRDKTRSISSIDSVASRQSYSLDFISNDTF